jgi:transposase
MNQENVKYLGIDVSKGYADFCLLDSQKQMVDKVFQLDDNRQGHQILKEYLQQLVRSGHRVACGLESTGGYELNWLRLIRQLSKELSVEVFKLNPKGIKHQIESTLKRTITDGVSARGIAEYLVNNQAEYQGVWQKNTHQKEAITSSQHCFNLVTGLIKQQTARYNQLEKLVYQGFPELLTYCKNGIPNWIIRLLKVYPGAAAVRRAQVRGVDAIKGITRAKADKIKMMAKESVSGSSEPLEELMIKTLAEDIEHHQRRIEQLKRSLIESGRNEQTNLICSIRGIGDWTATALSVLLGDASRFDGTDQLASFYGVHPRFKQSGDGKWGVRMSKQGNSAMRAVLYVAANNVILHNPYFKKLYHHYISKGKKRRAVVGIIMHKLLRIIYGMLRNHQPFNQDIDEANQQKNTNQTVSYISTKSRRYQQLETNAPISRSNHKKRRAELECQISTVDISTASSLSTPIQK